MGTHSLLIYLIPHGTFVGAQQVGQTQTPLVLPLKSRKIPFLGQELILRILKVCLGSTCRNMLQASHRSSTTGLHGHP